MRRNTLLILITLCSLLTILSTTVSAADDTKTIKDDEDDVIYTNPDTYEETITDDKPNIDITQVKYEKTGATVTVTLTVKGQIENRGSSDFLDENIVWYIIGVETSDHLYLITYLNETCQLATESGDIQNTTNYTVAGSTLSIFFDINSADEVYNTTYATSTDSFFYSDEATDSPLDITYYDIPESGYTDEEIQFDVQAYGGIKPYTYHWDFGDETTSAEDLATHTYTNPGNYTVTIQITDKDGTTAQTTGTIQITQQSNPEPDNTPSNLWLFGIIIVIIIIVGVILVVYILRR